MEQIGLRGHLDLISSWTPNVRRYTADLNRLQSMTKAASGGISGSMTRASGGIGNLAQRASASIGPVRGLTAALGGLGGAALKIGGLGLGAGIVAIGAGLTAGASAGLSFNNTMEQATAKINAFTKDGAKTAELLEGIRVEAAKTPFEFDEMANSLSGLLPAAKQADEDVMNLIRDAEILAASNPAEGLVGATFALREAVSGDFTSIIERFNLPRTMINQLKEEGLPNLEIVRRVMQDLGYDTDLVSALANTASGRWSTLKDTFTNLAGTITQPIFDTFSSGLGGLNNLLAENEPRLTAFANTLATGVAGGLKAIGGAFKVLSGQRGALDIFIGLREMGLDTDMAKQITDITMSVGDLFEAFQAGGLGGLAGALGIPPEVIDNITNAVTEIQRLADVFDQGFSAGGLSGGLSALFTDLGPQIQAGLTNLAGQLLAGIPTAMTAVTSGIASFLQANGPMISESVAGFAEGFWSWVDTAVSGIGATVGGLLLAIGAWVVSPEAQVSLLSAGNSIGLGIASAIATFVETAPEILDIVSKVTVGIAAGVAAAGAMLIAVGGQIVAGIISGLLESIGIDLEPVTLGELRTILGNIGRDIQTISNVLGEQIATYIREGFTSAVQAMTEWKDALTTKVNEMIAAAGSDFDVDTIIELGEDIMTGLWEGLKAKAPDVLEWLKGLIPEWVRGLADVAGAHSPATITMPLGVSLVQGLVAGAQSQDFADQFIDSLNLGSIFRQNLIPRSQRRDLANYIRGLAPQYMGALASGTFDAGMMQGAIASGAAGLNQSPQHIFDLLAQHGYSVNSLVGMVQEQFDALMLKMRTEALNTAVSVAGSFAGIASSFASMLQAQMGDLDSFLSDFEGFVDEAGVVSGDVKDSMIAALKSGADSPINKEIAALQSFLDSEEDLLAGQVWDEALGEFLPFALSREAAQIRLNELLEEQRRKEEAIARAQEQQQQLQFLQQQISLLKLIQDQGLSTSILDGITLGLGANLDDLMAATSAVVDAMIGQIDSDLQIASPSKKMEKRGGFVAQGLVDGILKGRGVIQSAMGAVAGAASGTNNVYNSTSNITVNMAGGGPGGATPAYEALQVRNAFRYKLAGV